MDRHDRFEELTKRVVHMETAPTAHRTHPGLDCLLDSMAGELASDSRARLAAHLATCPDCRQRLAHVREKIRRQEENLARRIREPELASALANRRGEVVAHEERASESWAQRLVRSLELHPVRGVAVAAVATAMVVLAVAVPLLRIPQGGPSSRIASLSGEVENLKLQVSVLNSREGTNQSSYAFPQQVTVEDMKALLDQARSINDEWRRALLLSSFLESKGLRLPGTATVDRVEAYTAQAGDTWESVAKEKLGDPSLWPILWLLNAEEASSQSELSPGKSLIVPRASHE